MNNTRPNKNTAFQLKGSLFTLTVFHLLKTDIDAINNQLSQLVKQTPKFFHHMPIVIDLQKIDQQFEIDFSALITCLREHKVIPVGIRAGSPSQQQAAIDAGLAVLPNTKTEAPEPVAEAPAKKVAVTPPAARIPAKLITQPVRSGQQIYARDSDLIVLGAVSHGAELLADGHIHVYGTLRGRALAGVTGDQSARIFCHTLSAELVAIAGHYWVNEDLQNAAYRHGVYIYLANDRLQVGTI